MSQYIFSICDKCKKETQTVIISLEFGHWQESVYLCQECIKKIMEGFDE